MQTKEEVEKAFREDLQALLTKYGAELSADDHWTGYSECGQDIRMTVEIPAIFDWDKCECVRERAEINLGTWISASVVEKPE